MNAAPEVSRHSDGGGVHSPFVDPADLGRAVEMIEPDRHRSRSTSRRAHPPRRRRATRPDQQSRPPPATLIDRLQTHLGRIEFN
jgi:hypothetical protein